MSVDTLIKTLRSELGDNTVLTDEQIGDKYLSDWSGESAGTTPPLAIIRPTSTDEVSLLLKHCHQARQAIVVQGGMTAWLANGGPVQDAHPKAEQWRDGIPEPC